MSRRAQQLLAKKRQKEFEDLEDWQDKLKYYRSWETTNSYLSAWNSSEYVDKSLKQYEDLKASQKKEKTLQERKAKLAQLFFDDQKQWDIDLMQKPKLPKRHYGFENISTNTLKDVNIGLKLAEEDRRRAEAEIKLYQQWKNENPILRNYEKSLNTSELKLAWLDQQIEKRMEQEKHEEELKKMLADRDRKIKEEEELESIENEEREKLEKELLEDIRKQMQVFQIKEKESDCLKHQEIDVMQKKREIDEILERNIKKVEERKSKEIAVYNTHYAKLKLKKKTLLVEEELREHKLIIEEIIASKTAEEIEEKENREKMKESIYSFLNYVKEQQKLEEQRQKYIGFIFDSEAKSLWEKQDKQWTIEKQAREKLLNDIIQQIRHQINEKLTKNLEKQKNLIKDREEMLQKIEEHNKQVSISVEEMEEKKEKRRRELEEQINEKRLKEFQEKVEEERQKREEINKIKKEEEKLTQELMKIQSKSFQPRKYNRRIIW